MTLTKKDILPISFGLLSIGWGLFWKDITLGGIITQDNLSIFGIVTGVAVIIASIKD